MSHKVKEVELNRIYLDNDNPRHDPIAAEPEIIHYLIENSDIKPLARHIAESGETSPLERIGLFPHPKIKDAYLAAEGNRRICSLKLLADPDRAGTESDRTYFRKLANEMKAPLKKSIEAVIFDSRAASRRWVSLRHEGHQGGVGTVTWTTGQIARFNSQGETTTNPNIQSLLLVDYAREKGLLDAEQIDKLALTTLTRYLSTPVFRDMLGLVDRKTLTISVPLDEFERVVTRFLSDTLDKQANVNSRSKETDRRAYTEKLRAEGIAPATRGQPLIDVTMPPPSAAGSQSKEPAAPPSSRRRDNRSPENRPRVIPSKFSAQISDKMLKRLYDELKSLQPDSHPFSCNYLLRAFIERMTVLYLQQHGYTCPGEFHKRLLSLEAALQEELKDPLKKGELRSPHLKTLRVMGNNSDDRSSAQTLGHIVHAGAVPTRTDLIRTWDNLEPVTAHVLSKLK